MKNITNLLLLAVSLVFTSCANPHFFPRTKPLFPGLDEQKMSESQKASLAKAKTDFMLIKQGKAPAYAKLDQHSPHSQSRVYQGNGYVLTAVNHSCTTTTYVGPDITIGSSITGGKAYRYDEIDSLND